MEIFWKNDGWEEGDRHLVALSLAPFQRKLPCIDIQPGVTIIRGPRQVGKSTWMKLLLKEQIQKQNSVFYTSCEDLKDHVDLLALIQSQKQTKVFFLDEITFVAEWWRAIKKIVDSRIDVSFVITGSNTFDLRKGADLMPGRMNPAGGEHFLLPMLFDEWCEMRKQAGWAEKPLLEMLRGFMKVGGFPSAVAEGGENFTSPLKSREVYLRWLRGDVIKLGKQELFMREVMNQIVTVMGTPLSLQSFAQKTQLMSYHTVQDYLSILEQSFALRTLYAYNSKTDSFHFKKDKKFYFTDPIIFWVACDWAGKKLTEDFIESSESKLAEMMACEWLYRKHPRMGYHASREGEIDFIAGDELLLEVKWSPVVKNLSEAYKKSPNPHKKVWCQNNFFE